MKKIILTALIFLTSLQAQAFEDIIISSDSKFSDIKIKDNSIINIYPLTTIKNEKNILFIIPQKKGETNFSVINNNKIKIFNVIVKENKTILNNTNGFEITTLDKPPVILDCDIDNPPIIKHKKTINIDGATIEIDSNSEVDDNG